MISCYCGGAEMSRCPDFLRTEKISSRGVDNTIPDSTDLLVKFFVLFSEAVVLYVLLIESQSGKEENSKIARRSRRSGFNKGASDWFLTSQ